MASILSSRGAEKPKPGPGASQLTQADLNLFAMLGVADPDADSQIKSQSGEMATDIRRPDGAVASEGPDSIAMASGIEFDYSNPIHKNE